MTEPQLSPIQYPTEFPIKVRGRNAPGFTEKVLAIVRRHAPDFDPTPVQTRPSRKNSYLSVTCVIIATSREQLDALYSALTSHPMVKIVL